MEEKIVCQCCGLEYYKKECQRCGKEFNASNPRNTFCSVSCVEKKRYSKKKTKQCQDCGAEFIGKKSRKKCDDCLHVMRIKNGSKNMIAMKKKLGVDNPMQLDWVKEKVEKTCQKKYGVNAPLQSKEIKEKVRKTCQERYGVDRACMRKEYRLGANTISSINKTFGEKLGENTEYEFPLERFSYDIKYDNTLIDLNPYPYHNLTWHPFDTPISQDYHKLRAEVAHNHGYQYIALFDWDDRDKIISMVRQQDKEKKYARKLEVKEVDPISAKQFLIDNHLQSDIRGSNYIAIGLYERDELIMITTWGKPRYNKNYHYELLRLCSKSSVMVVGGFKKMLNHFIENYAPKSIISYCDLSKFNGSVYRDAGFREKQNQPSLHFYNPKTGQHLTYNLLKRKGFDLLIGGQECHNDCVLGEEIFRVGRTPNEWTPIEVKKGDKIPFLNDITERNSTDNKVLMEKFGFLIIPDCGQTTYTLSLDNEE